MKTLVCAAVAATFMACAPAAWAQSASATPSKRELVLQYMDIMDMDQMMTVMGRAVSDGMMTPDVPPNVAKAIKESTTESLAAVFPRLRDRIADLYAEALTEDELKALIAFYGSPTGKALVAKTEKLASATTPLMREFAPIMQRDMLTRLCGKIECPVELKAQIDRLNAPGA